MVTVRREWATRWAGAIERARQAPSTTTHLTCGNAALWQIHGQRSRSHPGYPRRQPDPAVAARRISQAVEAGQPYDKPATRRASRARSTRSSTSRSRPASTSSATGSSARVATGHSIFTTALAGRHPRATDEELKDPLSSAGGGQDRVAFPEFYAECDRASGFGARLGKRFVVNGPLVYFDAQVKRDIANLKAAAAKVGATDAFLPVVAPASALPGCQERTLPR